MVDNKTAHLALPLPDLSNMQDEDVPRIGGALSMLDAHAQQVDSALRGVDAALESQGREVEGLKTGSKTQAGSLDALSRALETEKAERSDADEAAAAKLQELTTGQDDLGERVDTLGETSADHAARLEAAEQGITAISTTLIGGIMSITAAEGYVPNGTVPADAAEYTREQFREFYDTYLVGGKLITCTYAAFAAQVALTGNCTKFALDKDAQKFKVPLYKDGDSITQALSASEIGKSVKAGLPNFAGWTGVVSADGTLTGPFYKSSAVWGVRGGDYFTAPGIYFDPSRVNGIFGNSATVTDEQVRLRHFVILASAQNSASVFDWSNYMAGLAGKANTDFSNLAPAAVQVIKNSNTASALSTCTTSGDWTITGCKIGVAMDIICDVLSVDGNGDNRVNMYTKSGAIGGTGGAAVFGLVRANGWYSTNVFRCYPTSASVVIGVERCNGVRLTAMQ
ncbi:MAG TPA: hypothetical protein VEZ52_09920 [Desulfovibrio sp.]|uniref:hypothetical protein n=1 Tax=Desulfovibrio sp. TaxID=885 RepID=UPI002D280FD6|nr:hypothetical protein [Desulfovibrio sp.]HZF61923.1 hypothetical protein [Desulfovibrio sp.]